MRFVFLVLLCTNRLLSQSIEEHSGDSASVSAIHTLRGLRYDSLGDSQKALTEFEMAVSFNPSNYKVLYLYGREKAEMGRHREAISILSSSVRFNKQDTVVLLATLLTRARSKLMVEDSRGALSDCNVALKLSPGNLDAIRLQAGAKYNMQDATGAIKDFTTVINAKPDGESYFYRGIAELSIGQKENGCLDLSKSGEYGYTQAFEAIKKYCN
ncbi:MAG: tetratricopeptide repeat protein [Bacteroidota bacterium]